MVHGCLRRRSLSYSALVVDDDVPLMATTIRQMMQRKGWTQRQLSLASGITQSTLSRLLAAKQNPKASTMVAVVAAFGMSWEEFVEQCGLTKYTQVPALLAPSDLPVLQTLTRMLTPDQTWLTPDEQVELKLMLARIARAFG